MAKYTLIITEKPDAANRIADALDEGGNAKKILESGVPYYRAFKNGEIIVVPALGHLYTVASKEKNKRGYPVFEYQWVPRYLAERGASKIRIWLKVIAKLASNAEEFVDACDFDIEGSIIGYNILKYACGNKEENAKRMKYSTLTRGELQESYANLMTHLDFTIIEAGLTRHEVDWLYGINLSRALTIAVKNSGGHYATLSTGRVQGPTLKFLEDREKTIKCFVPTPFWTMAAKMKLDGTSFEAEYEKILENKGEATEIVAACKAKEGLVETVTVEEFEQNPPVPFDLGTLQSEAYRIFHYTPIRTSNIAQHLYLNALISYPRTSSQKLPPTIDYGKILKKLNRIAIYTQLITKLLSESTLKPREGQKVDSAHPAIYPTGNQPEKPLGISEKNIFDLIICRFLAVFGKPAIRQNVKVIISLNSNLFKLSGARTLNEGWLQFYKPYYQLKDVSLPTLIKGQKIDVKKVLLKENFFKPPSRYNPRSLLLKMEKEGIGTKATRASTIQTLHDRKYFRGESTLVISDLGFEVMAILTQFCPNIVSAQLTQKLEAKMVEIQQGNETKQAVLQDAIAILGLVINELKQNESVIGKQLDLALKQAVQEENMVGVCPKCIGGKLVILRSKKTGKRFVGCTNYFPLKCNVTYPLPQNGSIKQLTKPCKICGSPTIYLFKKGRKPWKLCIDPKCPSKGAETL